MRIRGCATARTGIILASDRLPDPGSRNMIKARGWLGRSLEVHEVSLAAALFALSGASGLMLEVVWSRMLGWLLGGTTWAVMTILVAFMGGLGLGGIFWG